MCVRSESGGDEIVACYRTVLARAAQMRTHCTQMGMLQSKALLYAMEKRAAPHHGGGEETSPASARTKSSAAELVLACELQVG